MEDGIYPPTPDAQQNIVLKRAIVLDENLPRKVLTAEEIADHDARFARPREERSRIIGRARE